jgi:hypothetical protein
MLKKVKSAGKTIFHSCDQGEGRYAKISVSDTDQHGSVEDFPP